VLPGVDSTDLIATEFAKCDAMFAVSPRRILITAQPKQVLMGFRNLVNRLKDVDGSDRRKRVLVWVLDLGRPEFEDGFRFLNVQELRSRFKALKWFKELDTEARWKWLQSNAVIVLHDDPRRASSEGLGPRPFAAHHALFTAFPPSWEGLPQFRALYGSSFERMDEVTFSIFLRRLVKNSPKEKSSKADSEYELRYFGHAPLGPAGDPNNREARGLKLPSPGETYEDAFRTIYAAAAEILSLNVFESIDGQDALDRLRALGFRFMDLEQFMKDL
jgi:hypothetical protein